MASPLMHWASSFLLAGLWILFALAHVARFMETGQLSLVFFCISETISAWFLLLRTQPRSFTKSPGAWAVAALGTFLPLLFRPNGNALFPATNLGVVAGVCIHFAAMLSLNRSFAMVPALREVKTGGLYHYVRHPVYGGYLVIFSFYLAGNFSAPNLLLLSAEIVLLFVRMHLEERHLCANSAYREYLERVRWRVCPHIY